MTIYYLTPESKETTDPEKAMEYETAYPMLFATFNGTYKIPMNVGGEETKGKFDPSTQTGTLKTVHNTVGAYQAGGQFTVSEIVTELKTAYGYTVDFAIRASKAGDLLLQQDAVDRVNNASEGSTTMGSGSMIQLTETADDIDDLSGLLKSLNIVFYNTRTGQIYCMATVDSTSIRMTGGKVQAPLELHNVNISDMGVITPGNRVDRILQMVEDETYYISALVYVNGDTIQGSCEHQSHRFHWAVCGPMGPVGIYTESFRGPMAHGYGNGGAYMGAPYACPAIYGGWEQAAF